MATQICSCEGLNPKCPICFGSGYVEVKDSGKTAQAAKEKTKKAKQESALPENLKSLQRNEIENIALKIIESLDLKSKKQMQVLNSIPFSTTTFRRDFKPKFESLAMLENQKRFLRSELTKILQETAEKKYFQSFSFGHYLSDKEIDVTSNRQLKELIRGYKKSKAQP
ncbi:hypothetical protein [Flavobacterium silvaticum]|uniref:Uncharacterized protein n=1 Tax=Flavobacterium silvaticum TaxID=1852020 RepID=A0A972FP66_9FLAO|nr:hypothetical protein [Flavobacterium silvaticum]NMH29282.1 hypothetical protein [Flavobacterium silvaticum]